MRCDGCNNYWGWSGKFQSTHLHEVWRRCKRSVRFLYGFNPHTYMRCDSKKDWRRVSFPCFNPHTYMRCDSSVTGIFRHLSVSIHTPTWGVTFVDENNVVYGMFQSTHLHEVWLGGYQQKWTMYMFQSTHLHEVWLQELHKHRQTSGFQSTHLHEVWLTDYNSKVLIPSFNPHTYMRCDYEVYLYTRRQRVSIHTPTWGVTTFTARNLHIHRFQSTHLHEVWHIVSSTSGIYGKFQSTHLHEVWLTSVHCSFLH